MGQQQIRAIVQRNLSNMLPGIFPRPSFEPHVQPIVEPVGVAGSIPIGEPHRCLFAPRSNGVLAQLYPYGARRGVSPRGE